MFLKLIYNRSNDNNLIFAQQYTLTLLLYLIISIQSFGYTLKHVESRPSSSAKERLEYLITLDYIDAVAAIETLRQLMGKGYAITWTSKPLKS